MLMKQVRSGDRDALVTELSDTWKHNREAGHVQDTVGGYIAAIGHGVDVKKKFYNRGNTDNLNQTRARMNANKTSKSNGRRKGKLKKKELEKTQ